MAEQERVRVVVADDHPVFRDGVVRALSADERIEVVGQAGEGRAALAEIEELRPDVALVDYKLPNLNGLAIVRAAARDGLATRVLLLSAFSESAIVYKALEQGAAGFLPKEATPEEIADAVVACAGGTNVVPPELASALVSQIRLRAVIEAPALSQREREILGLIAAGKTVREIARELFLSVSTVKTHVQHLYEKLGVSDRAAAVAEAMRHGLIE